MKDFWKSLTKAGLTRQVLTWFLLISLVPLGIVSWISHKEARDQLHRDTEAMLHHLMAVQAQSLNATFEGMKVDILQESDRTTNSRFLKSLIQSFRKSQMGLSEFVGSYQWEGIKDQWSSDLITFWKEHGYEEILLLDYDGNILFTVTGGQDLGKNLFRGSLADSRLSAAARLSLETGRVKFSDLEYYSPKDNTLAGFLISPVIDESGEGIGLMAIQSSGRSLAKLLLVKSQGQAGEAHYLIGEDLCLRSPGALGGDYPVLDRPVKTRLTNLWHSEHAGAHRTTHIEEEKVLLYKGPHGREVLGMHFDISLPGLDWAYVAEIDTDKALASSRNLARLTLTLIGVMAVVIIVLTLFQTRRMVRPITAISRALAQVGKGNFRQEITIRADHELGNLVNGFNAMMKNLNRAEKDRQEQNWIQEGVNQLNDTMQGDLGIDELARKTIGFLCRYLDALTGAYYILDRDRIRLMGSFAFSARKGFRNEFAPGEGIVGQAALEQQTLEISNVPEDYVAITSGLGEKVPAYICVIPLVWGKKNMLLLEFGTFKRLTKLHRTFIDMVSPALSVAAQTALSRNQTRELLEKTQVQAEELQAREEELRDSNRLLEEQAADLKRSQKILQESQSELEQKNEQLSTQQEELRVANEELEEQAQDLKKSRHQVEMKNQELEQARADLEQRAKELSVSSKYKSEFMANMSHELRTPLNSLLILARLLGENKDGNLSDQQVEYSTTIYDSGKELLSLINEILDLSKIEAGRMETHVTSVHLRDFTADLERKFGPLARQKNLEFTIDTEGAPEHFRTDDQKFGQIIKNLLSNAFKFTARGSVRVGIGLAPEAVKTARDTLAPGNALMITVSDTGIGIPRDRLNSIFETFQQVDGTTSRKYGGTGLGLTISRELARLLGGELRVESREDEGSTFTLYLPRDGRVPESEPAEAPPAGGDPAGDAPHREAPAAAGPRPEPGQESMEKPDQEPEREPVPVRAPDDGGVPEVKLPGEVADDRGNLKPGEQSVLIVEDDMRFVRIMADLARARGFKVLVAEDGETGLHLADYFQPSGIVLDIGLPGIDGWEVMDRLKDNLRTRHIPVHFMTANDFSHRAMNKGAIGFLTKPVTMEAMQEAFSRIEKVMAPGVKRLLIVEDDKNQQTALAELLGGDDILIEKASTGDEAKRMIQNGEFHCIVLDYGLPDMNGLELIEALYNDTPAQAKVPVIIYTGRDLEPRERAMLDKYAQRLIIKDVHSEERLLDDTTLFLHRLEADLPESQQQILKMLHDQEAVFKGRKVLLVDDDMRNVFALSAILQEKQMRVTVAKNGVEALEKLEADPDVDLVLMDIMMPEMDGYEATEKIRSQARFSELPVIALTAKAMKGDRSKCIDAGASDYLAKPVDTDKLLSMMRVWLYRK